MAKTQSIRPNFSFACLKREVRSFQLVTSACTKRKFAEGVDDGGVTSALTAFAPNERARVIVARPIPEEPPVSTIVRSHSYH